MFAKNVGTVDRIARIVVGLGLIAGFFLNDSESAWRYLYLIGVVPLITGLTSTCPAYSIFGISTCKTG
ncbi:MAG: YgaP family membrane protein [Rhodovulum sp.]